MVHTRIYHGSENRPPHHHTNPASPIPESGNLHLSDYGFTYMVWVYNWYVPCVINMIFKGITYYLVNIVDTLLYLLHSGTNINVTMWYDVVNYDSVYKHAVCNWCNVFFPWAPDGTVLQDMYSAGIVSWLERSAWMWYSFVNVQNIFQPVYIAIFIVMNNCKSNWRQATDNFKLCP